MVGETFMMHLMYTHRFTTALGKSWTDGITFKGLLHSGGFHSSNLVQLHSYALAVWCLRNTNNLSASCADFIFVQDKQIWARLTLPAHMYVTVH